MTSKVQKQRILLKLTNLEPLKFILTIVFFIIMAQIINPVYAEINYLKRDEKNEEGPRISHKYYEGSFLLYDCENSHWACVDGESFTNCKLERKKNLAKHPPMFPPCAPIKEFETIALCTKEQKRMVNSNRKFSFCQLPKNTGERNQGLKRD